MKKLPEIRLTADQARALIMETRMKKTPRLEEVFSVPALRESPPVEPNPGGTTNPNVTAALDAVGALGLDGDDWLELALECLDQGGVDVNRQQQIRKLIGA